jgi:tetratricopeptide (TPR) repeat protein
VIALSRLPTVLLLTAILAGCGMLHAATSENMAERTLKRIVERQREVFATAAKQGEKMDEGSVRTQLQGIVHEYELLLRDNPTFAAGYAAYGYLLSKVDMRKEAAAMLLKANQLDPDIPLVKNQLGNFMAEDGKPLQAAPYFLAAIKLEPNEPLYHYQLASLLSEARDAFLKSGEWSRPALDGAMLEGFRRAHELAPDRFEFAYRHAESFYDLEKPDWEQALKLWSALEEKATTPIERQTMRLHAANILIKLDRRDHARALLATVEVPELQGQKQRLAPLLEPKAAK